MKTRCVPLVAFLFLGGGQALVMAQGPKVLDFRIQEVNQKIYFHVRVARPADMQLEGERRNRRFDPWWDMGGAEPAVRPRLVPQDEASRLVYARERFMDRFDRRFDFKDDFRPPNEPKFDDKKEPVKEPEPKKDPDEKKDFDDDKRFGKGKGDERDDNVLEFYGVLTGKTEAGFLLIYPKETAEEPKDAKKLTLVEMLSKKNAWSEVTVKLDPSAAKKVPVPAQGFRRDEKLGALQTNDLEGNWALAQAVHFTQLAALTPEFSFYAYARETTARTYKVPMPWTPWMEDRFGRHHHRNGMRQTYEITTGAAAITESLALNRMRDRGTGHKEEPRTIPISKVRGIDIDEHPWVKMMGAKKPAAEPLARLVPYDNYYIHFKSITKFLETGDLLDAWGTSLARAFEVNSRDHRIKQKLEQQLCLKSTGMARIFGPAVIKNMAITGNDPQFREGSDFSMIFQVSNKFLFDAGTSPYLAETRKKFAKEIKEDKNVYQGITIESFVTPLREVSLHRASFGEYTVYSNSNAAVRRIIDAHKGQIKCLADALDFQYMRTVFRLDDPTEDGFVFLSDAFIRNLVGPVVRIKERRRLEALTSMHMVTNGAMYTAWETGKLPQNHDHILAATGMQARDLFSPDGNAIFWNNDAKVAVSNVYNTQHFATPLIEIPIDNVTPSEARDYENFRLQYMGLWRQFFDPIGVRLSMKKEQVRAEIYILPLVKTTQYNELRRVTGDGTLKLDSSFFSDKTLFQHMMHISPNIMDRGFGGGEQMIVDLALRSWLGEWFTVRFDDSPIYAKLMESYIRAQMFPEERHDILEDVNLALQMPVTIGFDVRSPMVFAGLLTGVRKSIETTLPGVVEWGPMKEPYKGVSIVQIRANAEQLGRRGFFGGGAGDTKRLDPTFYYAMVDGAFFLSLRESPIRDLIDRSVALKDKKTKGDPIEINSSVLLGPKAAVQSKELLRMYLEWETHRRAQLNNRLLYGLFRSNVVGPQDASAKVEDAAMQYLGFVPVSPDLAPFRYERSKEEVVNLRHGTLRQPKLNPGVDADSPLGRMLEEFATIRADLRFREDGIHTTLTFKRNGK